MPSRLALCLFVALPLFSQPRQEALRKMEQVMGPLPQLDRNRSLAVQTVSSEDAGSYTQTKLTYEPEPGRRVGTCQRL